MNMTEFFHFETVRINIEPIFFNGTYISRGLKTDVN